MKNWANLFFIVGIAILFLTRCSKERTITIDIKNTPPGYICALLPIDEETSVVPIDTFYWKSDTTFKIKVNTKGVATSMMLWGKDVGPIFTVCGNDKFMILIDQNLYGQKFRFEGINAEARQKVHEVVSQRNPYIYEFTRDYSKIGRASCRERVYGLV